ncbi:MAG: heterodisulfide reductase-related iron-sulfur binding cluster [Thermoleophilia bacterium]
MKNGAAKVRELHQFLATNPIDTDLMRDTSDSGAPTLVTWHDPCHMRYRLGKTSGPREIIARLPGVEYVESGQEQSCCGGGGLFGLMHYDLAQSIGMKRAGEIASSGSEDLTGDSMRDHLMEQFQEVEADLVTLTSFPDGA